jgi:tRNA(Glu) U13 pseudouridine synthase TruD
MTGVQVKISLPASSYATVCLREIIGSDSNMDVEEDMDD